MSILGAKLWFIGAFNSWVYTELRITFLLQTYLLIDGFLSVKGPNTVELCQALTASDTISIWILALLFTDCKRLPISRKSGRKNNLLRQKWRLIKQRGGASYGYLDLIGPAHPTSLCDWSRVLYWLTGHLPWPRLINGWVHKRDGGDNHHLVTGTRQRRMVLHRTNI